MGRSIRWDWDVDRMEFGTGYWINDVILTKLTAQVNDFGGPGAHHDSILAAQLTILF